MEEQKEFEKQVKIDEFDELSIRLVPYDESVIKKTPEETISAYMELFKVTEPEVAENLKDGVHNVKDCFAYLRDMARKSQSNGTAMVHSDIVFKWAVNYFRSPVIEVEKKKEPEYKPSVDFELMKKKREEEEAKRKAEEAEKKRQEDINKNGLSLFDSLFS